MGFDVHLAPASGFLEWTSEQWDRFFESDPPSVKIGNSWSIGLVLDLIAHNLENDVAGSRFPLLMRLRTEDKVGWYHHELQPLLQECDLIVAGLKARSIDRTTLNYRNQAEVDELIASFRKRHPGKALDNLYDLNSYFFETFLGFAAEAQAKGTGLFVSY